MPLYFFSEQIVFSRPLIKSENINMQIASIKSNNLLKIKTQ